MLGDVNSNVTKQTAGDVIYIGGLRDGVGGWTQNPALTIEADGKGHGLLYQGTAVASTSGTFIDFTGIPSWAKRITVMFSGVSTSGTSYIQMQLGYSGGVETTGYLGSAESLTNGAGVLNLSSGFTIYDAGLASHVRHGNFVALLISGTTYSVTGMFGLSDTPRSAFTAGTKTLTGTLDRIRITTVNGTDTFDAGSINIMYEG